MTNSTFKKLKQKTMSQERSTKMPLLMTILIVAAFIALAVLVSVSVIKKNSLAIKESLRKMGSENQSIESKLSDQNEIKKFSNYAELEEFLEGSSSSEYYGGWNSMDVLDGAVEMSMPMTTGDVAMEKSAVRSSGGSDDFSKTNVQVEGVDEADIIKTDGEYIYALANKNLFIVKAYPADQTNIVSKIEFEDRPQNIYISENRLVVFGQNQQIQTKDYYRKFKRQSTYSFFKIFDISDKKNPNQIKDLDFEGRYSNSRMIGDYVYFLTTTASNYHDGEVPVPRILEEGKELFDYSASENSCLNCPDVFYVDTPDNGNQFISVAAINIEDINKTVSSQVYLLPSSQSLYVSEENLYLTYTKRVSDYELAMDVMAEIVIPKLSFRNQEKIRTIQGTEKFILSPSEKQNKIFEIIERYAESLPQEEQDALEEKLEDKMTSLYEDISKELEKTVIHRISINKNNLTYKGFGQVTGSVLNQFSMDESNGYFRIATTKNRTRSDFVSNDNFEQNSYSNLYVLDDNMNIVGSLEGLAKDERIYSVRFMQDRAYMVTFKQMDPLFVIDLKDPEKPTVLGELKIPGFSNYLHPYNDNLLIGLGKETSANQFGGFTSKGLKLSLFDVSDVASPKEVDKYVFENNSSSSIALNDHKAFLFSEEKNLLTIPLTTYENVTTPLPLIEDGGVAVSSKRAPSQKYFRGAAAFHIDETGFKLKGLIEHSKQDDQTLGWCGNDCYTSTVKRSLYIDDLLYTFSDNYIKLNKIEDLETVKQIELKKNSGDDWQVVN